MAGLATCVPGDQPTTVERSALAQTVDPTPTTCLGDGRRGLRAEYFDDAGLSQPKLTRIDPRLDFDWGSGSPHASLGVDTFSVRWSGFVEAPQTGSYNFITRNDDGVRVWIDGTLLIDDWTDHAVLERSAMVELQAGRHAITVEYYDNGGQAVVQLSWTGPGISRAVIPSDRLSPNAAGCAASTSLVGFWRFDETSGLGAEDATCSANHGRIRRPAASNWTAGKRSGALKLDGSSYLVAPGLSDMDRVSAANQVTVAAWVNQATVRPGWATIASRQVQSSGSEHFGLYLLDGRPTFILRSDQPGVHQCSAPTAAATSQWVHVAGTFDGQTARVYVDGAEACSFQRSASLGTDRTPLIIGGNANTAAADAQELFEGALDEVAVFASALSATDIAAVAADGLCRAAILAPGGDRGLLAQFHDAADFTSPRLARQDRRIDFDWGTGSPHPSIAPDTFSTRWSGFIRPRFSETYTFTVRSDDGVRLWINGALVVEDWSDHAAREASGTIALTAGTSYSIRLDHYDNQGGAVAQLYWQSAQQPREIVPAEALSPPDPCVTEPSLIGYWPFDDASGPTATDGTCHASHATFRGTGAPAWTTGLHGGALRFDGSSTWLRVPPTAATRATMQTNQLTVMGRINPSAIHQGWRSIASRQYGTTGHEHWGLYLLDGRPAFIVASHITGTHHCAAPAALTVGAWKHVAGVFDGQRARLLVDGVEACRFDRVHALADDTTPVLIGGNANSSADAAQELFAGTIDDVRLYAHALSDAEVAARVGAAVDNPCLLANGSACDDLNVCNGPDMCQDGVCVPTSPDTVLTCDDGDPSTVDTCDIVRGCRNTTAPPLVGMGQQAMGSDVEAIEVALFAVYGQSANIEYVYDLTEDAARQHCLEREQAGSEEFYFHCVWRTQECLAQYPDFPDQCEIILYSRPPLVGGGGGGSSPTTPALSRISAHEAADQAAPKLLPNVPSPTSADVISQAEALRALGPRLPGTTEKQGRPEDPRAPKELAPSSDPVDPVDGELFIQEVDMERPSTSVPFRLVRTYRSRTKIDGPLGRGWDHSYNQKLVRQADGRVIFYRNGEGQTIALRAGTTAGLYEPPAGMPFYLTDAGPSQGSEINPRYRMRYRSGLVRAFNGRGLLLWEYDATGRGQFFQWTPDEKLEWALGQQSVRFHYDGSGRLTEIEDTTSGLKATYTVDTSGYLTSATNDSGRKQSYQYNRVRAFEGNPDDYIPQGGAHEACRSSCEQIKAQPNCVDECKRTCGTSCADVCRPVCVEEIASVCNLATTAYLRQACAAVPQPEIQRACQERCALNRGPRDCAAQCVACFYGTNRCPEQTGSCYCHSGEEGCLVASRLQKDNLCGNEPARQRGVSQCTLVCAIKCFGVSNANPPGTNDLCQCQSRCAEPVDTCANRCLSENDARMARAVLASGRPSHGADGSPTRLYGYSEDLVGNLTHVFDAAGNLALLVEYEHDITRPGYDAVKSQTFVSDGPPGTEVPSENGVVFKNTFTYELFASATLTHPRICGDIPNPPAAEAAGVTRRTKYKDIYGADWTFEYDRNGRLVYQKNETDQTVRRFEYNARGHLVGRLEPGGARTCFVYESDLGTGPPDDLRRIVQRGAATGNPPVAPADITTDMEWRTFAAVPGSTRVSQVTVTGAKTTTTKFFHDFQGNLESVIDPENNRTTFVPDREKGSNAPKSQKRPDGTIVEYVYERGTLKTTTVKDPAGDNAVTSLTPDTAGRPRYGMGPYGEYTEWSWNGGQLQKVTVTNQMGSATGVWNRQDTNSTLVREVSYTYDADGRVKTTDDGTTMVETTYDRFGNTRTVKVKPASGTGPVEMTCFDHGPDGRLRAMKTPLGDVYAFQYNGEGQVTHRRFNEPGSHAFASDCPQPPSNRPSNPQGSLEVVTYDADGRPSTLTDAAGQVTRFTYDGHGRLIVTRDPEGHEVRVGHDDQGRVLWRALVDKAVAGTMPYARPTEPAANGTVPTGLVKVSTFDYLLDGRIDKEIAWHFAKDTQNKFAKYTRQYTYDVAGRKVTVDDGVHPAVTTTLDGHGRVVSTSTPNGTVNAFSYSFANRTITRTAQDEPSEGVVATRLTTWGAPRRHEGTQDTIVARFGYDAAKRLVLEAAAGAGSSETTYDIHGRPDLVKKYEKDRFVDPMAAAIETIDLGWDPTGNLVRHESAIPGGATALTEFHRDPLGRVERLVRPGGLTHRYAYVGLSSRVWREVDPKGQFFERSYRPTGLLAGISGGSANPAIGSTESLASIAASRIQALRNKVFDYDAAGRLTTGREYSPVNGSETDVVYARRFFDSLDFEREVQTAAGTTVLRTSSHLPMAEREREAPAGIVGGAVTFTERWGASLRIAGVNLAQGGTTLGALDDETTLAGTLLSRARGAGLTTTYTYDTLGRLTGLLDQGLVNDEPFDASRQTWTVPLDGVPRLAVAERRTAANATAWTRTAAFRADGRARVLDESVAAPRRIEATIAWNATTETANQLVGFHFSNPQGAPVASYTLDGRHNWTSVRRPDGTTIEPQPDALDRYTRLEGTFGYDGNGSVTSEGDRIYVYDVFGRLVEVKSGGTTIKRYAYDPLDRLVKETAGTSETEYAYEGDQMVYRRRPDGVGELFVSGSALDDHLMQLVGPSQSSGNAEVRFFHQDRLGSVVMVSDAQGRPLEHYEYTAYGERRIFAPDGAERGASELKNPLGFQGHRHDVETGLVQMRARWYRPGWGRFLSLDPIGLAGGRNLYAFVGGAALTFADPYGLAPVQDGVPNGIRESHVGPTIGAARRYGVGEAFLRRYMETMAPFFRNLQSEGGNPYAASVLTVGEGLFGAYRAGGLRQVVRSSLPFDQLEHGVRRLGGARDAQDVGEGAFDALVGGGGTAGLLLGTLRMPSALPPTSPLVQSRIRFLELLHTRELGSRLIHRRMKEEADVPAENA